mgnify:CR=1 FL=1
MRRTSHKRTFCPIARGMGHVGDSWTVLILREAFYGTTRFDDFQKRLGIAPNMLAQRLHSLVHDGMLARRQYNNHPPRSEYILTDLGREFRPVLLMLIAWGNQHFSPEGAMVQLVERASGRVVQPLVVDALTREPITIDDHRLAPGPAASEALRIQLERHSEDAHPTELALTELALSATEDL